ncbi:unnamed protein product [Cuscuta campestris]|uniref:Cystatin domain-containing protein n=1 Tax=Cuscuta campestris TaxID=132261 RepID=A0A484KDM9_9ASTE|nr:unnamed protein product [Cuscuta campestris]
MASMDLGTCDSAWEGNLAEVDDDGKSEESYVDSEDSSHILDTFEDDEGTIVEYIGREATNTPPDYQDFSDPEDEKSFRQYREEFLASDGYDVTHFYEEPFVYGLMRPISLEPDDFFYEGCVLAVQRLITYLREKKGRTLEFVKLVKANRVIGTLAFYFATFTAMESGKLGTYQAKLLRSVHGDEFHIFAFREAPKVEMAEVREC